jgi:hypothetical protein
VIGRADESFSTSFRGTVKSSLGYEVRVNGKTSVRYRDELGRLDLDCEVLAGPEDALVLIPNEWPEVWGGLSQQQLLHRVTTALQHDGWRVERSDHKDGA